MSTVVGNQQRSRERECACGKGRRASLYTLAKKGQEDCSGMAYVRACTRVMEDGTIGAGTAKLCEQFEAAAGHARGMELDGIGLASNHATASLLQRTTIILATRICGSRC